MADENRPTGQIREGAGLEESRLNTDFIDWLRKWSSPVLFVAAGIALAYWAWGKYAEFKDSKLDQAFVELHGASTPEALLDIAEIHKDVHSVADIARLRAASMQQRNVLVGLEPGVIPSITPPSDDPAVFSLKLDGSLKNPEDELTDEEREARLDSAEQAVRVVYEDCKDDPAKWVLANSAMLRLATIEESRANWDEAKRWYDEVVRASAARGDALMKAIAEERLATLDSIKSPPRLFTASALPPVPEPPLEMIDFGAPTPLQPEGPPVTAPTGTDPAQPATPDPTGGEPTTGGGEPTPQAPPTTGGGG